jgi:hypothetical protein
MTYLLNEKVVWHLNILSKQAELNLQISLEWLSKSLQGHNPHLTISIYI